MEVWTDNILIFLRSYTRETMFDFKEVSLKIIELYMATNPNADIDEVSVILSQEECRNKFAQDYELNNPSDYTNEIRSNESKTLNTHSLNSSLDDLSFDEIIEHQEIRQKEYAEHQDLLFRRVLNSLKSGDVNQNHETNIAIDQEVQSALIAQQLKRETDKKNKIKRINQQNERRALEAQREVLRKRFEPGIKLHSLIELFYYPLYKNKIYRK